MLFLTILLNPVWLIILFALSLFITYLFIVPLARIHSYKREGILTYFHPVLGFFNRWFKNVKTHGDIMADSKRLTTVYSDKPQVLVSNLNSKLFFVLLDTKYTKEFLQNTHLYHKSPILDWAKMFVKNGLVTAEDQVWKRHRRIISSSFHYEFLKSNVSVIQDTVREFLDKIPADGCKDYPVITKMQEITGEVVGRIFFGENLNNYIFEGKPVTTALAELVSELSSCGWHPLVLLFGVRIIQFPLIPKFRRIVTRLEKFRQLCFNIVEERKFKTQQSNDLLASLVATQKSEDIDQRLSNDDIIDEFMTFFVAGMDTTAKTVGMTLFMLANYPQYLKSVKDERDSLYNKSNRVTTEDVQKMEVLHAVIKETLRFYSPAPTIFARKAVIDHKILDISVKAGDLVVADFFAPAYDEKNFENPLQFSPERWRNADNSKMDPYAFIPFSAGPRNCIGQHLAIIESKIIISEFLNRFKFTLQEPYDLKMTFKFVYETESIFSFELSPAQA